MTILCARASCVFLAWKDKLTSYNGAAITYDEIGNPLTDGTWTYTWAQGRKLQQIAKTGTTISYKYNDSGIRTGKTVNDVTTVYNVVGGFVTWEKTGSNNPIYYSYDASGSLWGMQYNGSMYFNVRNAQGDIIRLINSSSTVVVEYAYDAWGKLLSTTGSLASTLGLDNPYRYRGYRFDTETGLYYLQSRYYNPQWGRFVNADGILGIRGDINGHNIFSYCYNNPASNADPSGYIDFQAIRDGLDYMKQVLEYIRHPENHEALRTSLFGNRIPDFISGNFVGEIKNVAYLALTRQMKGIMEIARNSNKMFILIANNGTIISRPLMSEEKESVEK